MLAFAIITNSIIIFLLLDMITNWNNDGDLFVYPDRDGQQHKPGTLLDANNNGTPDVALPRR